MMTDEHAADAAMDAQLRAAGQRWRTAHDVGGVSADDWLRLQRRSDRGPRSHRAATLLSVAAVVLVAVGAGAWLALRPNPVPSTSAGAIDANSTSSRTHTATGTSTATPFWVVAAVVDRDWYLVGATGDSGSLDVLRRVGIVPTLKVRSTGGFVATVDDCMFYRGRLRTSDTSLTITSRVRGAFPCPSASPEKQQAASALLRVIDPLLTGTMHWNISHGVLTLSHSNSRQVLTYSERRSARTAAPTT
jgi:hypothetical protein